MDKEYILAGCKPWNHRTFNEVIRAYPGKWHYIDNPVQLTLDGISAFQPRYIFFLHWSWKVPQEVIDRFECVCFHMTDVPYGRGGSPLQNLIVRGHRETRLTALRMVQSFDAGPVYMKANLSLEGSAEEIYIRASRVSAEMIREIVEKEPIPKPQIGEPIFFKRRKPEESQISEEKTLVALYDFIRMLDAQGYPQAFLESAGFRFEFSRAALYDGRIEADVRITPISEQKV
jgi:methionyl-tRNA formyltransferase